MKLARRKIIAVGLVALVVFLALLPLIASPGKPQLSAYGARSDLSRLRESVRDNGVEVTSIVSSPLVLNQVRSAENNLYMAIGVEREYLPGEIDALVAFHGRGGSLLIVDDFGFANALSRRFGISFDKRALRDESFTANPEQVRNQSLVPVNVTFDGRSWSILTDTPTSLGVAPGADGDTVARTTGGAYVDAPAPGEPFGNGVKDGSDFNDPRGFAVIYVSKDRRLAFVSDPHIFSNDLMLRSDYQNQDMAARLVDALFRDVGGTAFVDESRHAPPVDEFLTRLLISVGVVPTQDSFLRIAVVAGGVVVAILAMFTLEKPRELLVHESRLDSRLPHPRAETPLSERLRESAIHKVKIVHGIDNDAWARMGLAEGSRLVADDRLRELIFPGREVRPAEVAELIGRIKDYRS